MRIVAAILGVAFCGIAGAQALQECKTPDGRVELIWGKCPEGSAPAPSAAPKAEPPKAEPAKPEARKPEAKKAEPPKAEAKKAQPKDATGLPDSTPRNAQIEMEMVVEIMSGYPVCVEDVTGFREKYGASYDFWKLRNAAMIARVQSNPAARREIDRRLAEGRGHKSPSEQNDLANYCQKLIGPFLEGKFAGASPAPMPR